MLGEDFDFYSFLLNSKINSNEIKFLIFYFYNTDNRDIRYFIDSCVFNFEHASMIAVYRNESYQEFDSFLRRLKSLDVINYYVSFFDAGDVFFKGEIEYISSEIANYERDVRNNYLKKESLRKSYEDKRVRVIEFIEKNNDKTSDNYSKYNDYNESKSTNSPKKNLDGILRPLKHYDSEDFSYENDEFNVVLDHLKSCDEEIFKLHKTIFEQVESVDKIKKAKQQIEKYDTNLTLPSS